MLIIAVILWWVLEHTPVGRYIYAIGSSPEAARLSGRAVNRYTGSRWSHPATIAASPGVFFSASPVPR